MPLDVHNPWEAVAYFTLGFYCEDCKASIDFDSPHEPCSNEWCIQLAKIAFERGWFIKHPDTDGSMDVGTAWCPQCGNKRGLTQPAFETICVKNFDLISFANAHELAARAASAWLDEIESANRADKIHCVALSGGRITQKFFNETVKQAKARGVSFERVHFFWADERCVPPTDAESNFKMANDLLFAPLKISENQIHRLRGEDAPDNALKIAEAELHQFATNHNGRPVLDLILLGMGEDGHVASLFPNAMSDPLQKADCNSSFFALANSPKPPPCRISLNYEAIIAAKKVFVLASGAGKEIALKNSFNTEEQTPLSRILRRRPATKIFSDLPQN